MFGFLLRKRKPMQTVTGGNTRIALGTFGFGNPHEAFSVSIQDPSKAASLYNYHEGDVFLPGAGNIVFEPNFELPLQTVWGFGFVRYPNTFKALQPPQVWAHPHVVTNGVGGLQAGTIEHQGLSEG